MTEEEWARVVDKDPRYAKVAAADLAGESVGWSPCKFLGERVSAFRLRCRAGVVNPDGLGGVKPCCDCGPGKCVKYRANDD